MTEDFALVPPPQPPRLVRTATFGPSGAATHRFCLEHVWAEDAQSRAGMNPRRVCWVMLNPSVANTEQDDPTIRRCRAFSEQWGFAGMIVVNLFAYRATDQRELLTAADPVGPGNDEHLKRGMESGEWVIAAWGVTKSPLVSARAAQVWPWLRAHRPYCLGYTKAGDPRHPLFVPGIAPPMTYQRPEEVK